MVLELLYAITHIKIFIDDISETTLSGSYNFLNIQFII